MACIRYQTPAGTVYSWPEGKARTPIKGEIQLPDIDWNCGDVQEADELSAIFQKEGIKWGTAIKYVAKKLGATHCSRCSARDVILNDAGELGWTETIKRLKETF